MTLVASVSFEADIVATPAAFATDDVDVVAAVVYYVEVGSWDSGLCTRRNGRN